MARTDSQVNNQDCTWIWWDKERKRERRKINSSILENEERVDKIRQTGENDLENEVQGGKERKVDNGTSPGNLSLSLQVMKMNQEKKERVREGGDPLLHDDRKSRKSFSFYFGWRKKCHYHRDTQDHHSFFFTSVFLSLLHSLLDLAWRKQ